MQKPLLRSKDTYGLKGKECKKITFANKNQTRAGMARFPSDQIDLRSKIVTRDKEEHYNDKTLRSLERSNKCKYMCT